MSDACKHEGITIRAESSSDYAVIAVLHRRAFNQDAEARLVRALGEHGVCRLSLVAEADGYLVAHILLSEIQIERSDSSCAGSLSLAFLADLPEFERQGIATRLITDGLRRTRDAGFGSVFVVGSTRLYGRCGFSAELARSFKCPYAGEHFQTIEPWDRTGTVVYSEPLQIM